MLRLSWSLAKSPLTFPRCLGRAHPTGGSTKDGSCVGAPQVPLGDIKNGPLVTTNQSEQASRSGATPGQRHSGQSTFLLQDAERGAQLETMFFFLCLFHATQPPTDMFVGFSGKRQGVSRFRPRLDFPNPNRESRLDSSSSEFH